MIKPIKPIGQYVIFFIFLFISLLVAFLIERVCKKKFQLSKWARIVIFIVITSFMMFIYWEIISYHPSHEFIIV